MLISHVRNYELFQLLFLIEKSRIDSNQPNDIFRIIPTDSLLFSPSIVHNIDEQGGEFVVHTSFPGLLGPNGVLKQNFVDKLLSLAPLDATLIKAMESLHRFLIFLQFILWKKNRFYLQQQKKVIDTVLKLLGVPSYLTFSKLFYEHPGLLRVAPFLLSKYPTRQGLISILKGFFNLEFVIKTHSSRWQVTPSSRLNKHAHDKACFLGRTAFLGRFAHLSEDQIAIEIETDNYDYLSAYPARNLLDKVIRFYLKNEVEYRLRVSIKKSARKPCYLSGVSLLGLATFLMVPRRGFEPPRFYPQVPETCVSTNSTTSA